ncbi:hypothetical protein [Streptomyces sp. NBC_01022]|uniref:hypothetical protein n=1 Tax=Streptomyces sp. NBC_01022 TaxID=2903723 RepID=UPI002DDADD42|nr:hypothetical protein [Streptomyces sp. NBC_01022]WRZ78857.1 hypothetical protein OG316_00540 [Streptomyces sp. NBC_01022]WRZ86822.1 hypothetical protein OG316_44355 [Streptomyces sp. NBC_01022]
MTLSQVQFGLCSGQLRTVVALVMQTDAPFRDSLVFEGIDDVESRQLRPRFTTPRALGVDDFALRRGRTCSTVFTSVEGHRVVNVLHA